MIFLSLFSIPYVISYYLENKYVRKHLPVILLYYLLMLYVITQYDKLMIQNYTQWDFFYVFPYLDSCDIFTMPQERAVIKFYQFCLSQEIFGNPKIIPFAESVGILIVSFFLTNRISRNHFAGLIAVTIIMASKIFSDNTTSFGYSTEWVFFFILAVYLIYTKPVLSGPVYLLSILAKGVTILFLPIIFYLIFKSDISKRSKKISYLSLGAMLVFVILYTLFAGNHFVQTNIPIQFHPEKLEGLLYNIYYNFTVEAQDPIILFLIPVILIGLNNKPILLFVVYAFSMQVWLPLLSDYNMGSYRMVPFVIMLSIGAAVSLAHHMAFLQNNHHGSNHTNHKKNGI